MSSESLETEIMKAIGIGDWKRLPEQKQLKLKALILSKQKEAEEKVLDEKMGAIPVMISEFIQSRWPNGDVLRARESTTPIDYDPLIRKIRDYANDNSGAGLRLNRAIEAADKAIDAIIKTELSPSTINKEVLGMKIKTDDRLANNEIRFYHPDGRSEGFKL